MTSRTEYCSQTPNKPSLFDVPYLRNHRTLDIGVLGYIGIVWPKEHSPEFRSFPLETPCILLSQVYCVWQVVKTPTIISNNSVFGPVLTRYAGIASPLPCHGFWFCDFIIKVLHAAHHKRKLWEFLDPSLQLYTRISSVLCMTSC